MHALSSTDSGYFSKDSSSFDARSVASTTQFGCCSPFSTYSDGVDEAYDDGGEGGMFLQSIESIENGMLSSPCRLTSFMSSLHAEIISPSLSFH